MNHSLYYKAITDDDAWHDELIRLFGNRAGDVRYTKQGEGIEGSLLNELYCAHRISCDAWVTEMKKGQSK